MKVPGVTSEVLKAELTGPNPPRILDVREVDELAISRFPEIVHVPLATLSARFRELDKSADWVVVCRSGVRSSHATTYLLQLGFTSVRNLEGGMNGWVRTIDPTMTVY